MRLSYVSSLTSIVFNRVVITMKYEYYEREGESGAKWDGLAKRNNEAKTQFSNHFWMPTLRHG